MPCMCALSVLLVLSLAVCSQGARFSDGTFSVRAPLADHDANISSHGDKTCVDALLPHVQSLTVKRLFGSIPKSLPFWRLFWRGDVPQNFSYQDQWQRFGKEGQIFNGVQVKWGDIMSSEPYVFERRRLEALGRIEESSYKRITWSSVKSICDLSVPTIKNIIQAPKFIDAVAGLMPSSACGSNRPWEIAQGVKRAIERECFDECLGTLASHIVACDGDSFTNDTFEKALDESKQCAELSFDSLEDLAEQAISSYCLDFPPPSLLWHPEDHANGEIVEPVCGVKDNRSVAATGAGTCPEGTACECPMTEIFARQSVQEIRGAGEHLFVREGTAAAPSILKQYASGFVSSTLVMGVGLKGLSVTAALAATVKAPVFLIPASIMLLLKNGVKYALFHCKDTVGCWPQASSSKAMGCRMSPSASKDGSPLWFLPPPGTRLVHKGFKCALDRCEPQDMKEQRVGLHGVDGKKQLFNCQLLSFAQMTKAQRTVLLDRLRNTGAQEEYAHELSAARTWLM